MKIAIETICCLAREGRLTLQVPEFDLTASMTLVPTMGAPASGTIIDVPDDYFTRLHDDRPCLGREVGYTYLSRKGYNAMKLYLKAAFDIGRAARGGKGPAGQPTGPTWADFERAAREHFRTVAERIKQDKTKLKARLAALGKVRV